MRMRHDIREGCGVLSAWGSVQPLNGPALVLRHISSVASSIPACQSAINDSLPHPGVDRICHGLRPLRCADLHGCALLPAVRASAGRRCHHREARGDRRDCWCGGDADRRRRTLDTAVAHVVQWVADFVGFDQPRTFRAGHDSRRPLSHHRPARPRRHGRGLPGRRFASRPAGRAEVPA